MAYPAPVATGNGNIMNFLFAAETGIYIQAFSRKTGSKKVPFYNAVQGLTDGEIYHDFMADYDVKGKWLGNTSESGVGAASVGVSLTLANLTSGNGVTSGGIYTQDTNMDHTEEQAADWTVTAKQLPGIA